MAPRPEIVAYLRDAAIKRGIDPDVATRVAASEALNVFDPDKPDRGGDDGSSFGLFQLHYANMSSKMPNAGLGDVFTKMTGLDARDPSTWRQQIDFSLDYAKNNGWGSWMGAKRVGIQPYEGIGGGGSPRGPVEAAGGGRGSDPGAVYQTPPLVAETPPVVDMNNVYEDLLASRPDQSQDLPRSLLADTMASSVGRRPDRGGGLIADSGDQNQGLPALEAAPAAVPEEAPVVADAAQPPTPLADLFKVKDIGLAAETDPLTGIPRLLRTRRAYG